MKANDVEVQQELNLSCTPALCQPMANGATFIEKSKLHTSYLT